MGVPLIVDDELFSMFAFAMNTPRQSPQNLWQITASFTANKGKSNVDTRTSRLAELHMER